MSLSGAEDRRGLEGADSADSRANTFYVVSERE